MLMNWLPENVSSFGGDIDGIMSLINSIVFVWLVLAEILLIGFVLVFRHKKGRKAQYITGTSWKAMSFVLIPAAIVLCLDLFIDYRSAKVWTDVKETLPPSQHLIRVTGEQFLWTFTYSNQKGDLKNDQTFSSEEMVVPVDQVIQLELVSTDVIHSLWIPNLRFKQDLVPGRTIKAWFKATKLGEYPIACAELCGMGHGYMGATLKVVSSDDYDRWINENSAI